MSKRASKRAERVLRYRQADHEKTLKELPAHVGPGAFKRPGSQNPRKTFGRSQTTRRS